MDTVDDLVPAQPSIWDRIAGFLTQQVPVERRSAPEPGTPPQPTVIDQFVTGAARGMWDLPRKMIEGSQAHYETGNYDPSVPVEAALTAMTGGMPMAVRGAAGAAGGKLVQPPIRAYHGSPYDFDKFDMRKIGTGEGAQAYGYGLYFAENPAVALDYKQTLSKRNLNIHDADKIDAMLQRGAPDEEIIATLQKRGNPYAEDELKRFKAGGKGKMYEVDIHADPSKFLDWDVPLAQQPDILKAIKEAAPAPGFWARQMQDMPVIRHARATRPESTGREAYTALGRYLGGDKRGDMLATGALKEQGIPGVKYLDQGSRAVPTAGRGHVQATGSGKFNVVDDFGIQAGPFDTLEQAQHALLPQKQTYNYAVFDDRILDIVKKYGLGGMSLLPPAAAAYLQQHLVPVEGDPFGNGT